MNKINLFRQFLAMNNALEWMAIAQRWRVLRLIETRFNLGIRQLIILNPCLALSIRGVKNTCLDVEATLDNETNVIVEMQGLNIEEFEKRILYPIYDSVMLGNLSLSIFCNV